MPGRVRPRRPRRSAVWSREAEADDGRCARRERTGRGRALSCPCRVSSASSPVPCAASTTSPGAGAEASELPAVVGRASSDAVPPPGRRAGAPAGAQVVRGQRADESSTVRPSGLSATVSAHQPLGRPTSRLSAAAGARRVPGTRQAAGDRASPSPSSARMTVDGDEDRLPSRSRPGRGPAQRCATGSPPRTGPAAAPAVRVEQVHRLRRSRRGRRRRGRPSGLKATGRPARRRAASALGPT